MSDATGRGVRACVALLLAAYLAWSAAQTRGWLLVAAIAALSTVFLAWAVLELSPRLAVPVRAGVAVFGSIALAGSLLLLIGWVVTGGG